MPSARVSMTMTRLDAGPDDFATVRCSQCDAELDFHQPDPDLPYRLLGTCDECKVWFLIDNLSGTRVLLPELLGSQEEDD